MFSALVKAERGRVERLVGRLLAFPDEVDDVVQEVFTRAWERAHTFRGDAAPDVWLRGIALRVARSANRNPFRRRRVVEAAEPVAPDDVTADETPDHDLQRALQRLPQKHREILVMRYLEDLPANEVAKVLGLTRAALDMRMSRARAALRSMLTIDGETI